jgi:hypothetical protein
MNALRKDKAQLFSADRRQLEQPQPSCLLTLDRRSWSPAVAKVKERLFTGAVVRFAHPTCGRGRSPPFDGYQNALTKPSARGR